MRQIHKYPRTSHIEGSGIQRGDEDMQVASFASLRGCHVAVEEKMDVANCGISFVDGRLLLQSRGHYLSGGPRERQFELLKPWASRYVAELYDLLGERFVLYGEWLYAKHSVFYTALPHYFFAFDMYDTHERVFLDTTARRERLRDAPFIQSVGVLHEGPVETYRQLIDLVRSSSFIGPDHMERLRAVCASRGIDDDQARRDTDSSDLMEGLYIKVEHNGIVTERYKYVRSSFLQTVFNSGSHWMDRPLIPNQLAADAVLF